MVMYVVMAVRQLRHETVVLQLLQLFIQCVTVIRIFRVSSGFCLNFYQLFGVKFLEENRRKVVLLLNRLR